MANEELILHRLNAIDNRLAKISDHLEAINGKLADHETRIAKRDTVCGLGGGTREKLVRQVSQHQSFIDGQAGATSTWRQTAQWAFQMLTLAVALAAILWRG